MNSESVWPTAKKKKSVSSSSGDNSLIVDMASWRDYVNEEMIKITFLCLITLFFHYYFLRERFSRRQEDEKISN